MTVALVDKPLMQSRIVSLCKTQLFSRGGELILAVCCQGRAVCCEGWARPVPTVRDQQLRDDGCC